MQGYVVVSAHSLMQRAVLKIIDIVSYALRMSVILNVVTYVFVVNFRQGFMQDQIIASHTCFGGHMDVNC